MSKKVIITGVAGQLGSYMAEHILENTDFQVVGTVRRSSNPDYSNLQSFIKDERFAMKFLDITDKASVESLINFERPDFFINLAGNSFLGNSWDSPYSHFDTNFYGVLHQLESIKNFCPSCKYLNAGSSEIFGDTGNTLQNELQRPNPRNPYGVAKSSAQSLVKAYRDRYGLNAATAILYNAESKRRSKDFLSRKVAEGVARIKKSIDKKENFEPLEVGNFRAVRDWSHASDFADGIWKMINVGSPLDYVLGSGRTKSVENFIIEAFRSVGVKAIWLADGQLENKIISEYGLLVKVNPVFYREEESFILCGDASRARNELGWRPKYTFQSLVEEIVEDAIG